MVKQDRLQDAADNKTSFGICRSWDLEKEIYEWIVLFNKVWQWNLHTF